MSLRVPERARGVLRAAGLAVPPIRRLYNARNALITERDALAAELARTQAKRDVLISELAAVCARREALVIELATTRAERNILVTERAAAVASDTVVAEIAAMRAALIQRDEQLTALEARTAALDHTVAYEQHRIDYVLAGWEGILAESAAFHAARATATYRDAFSDRNPLVSVCVATANRPDLLISRCLRSLQEQTYQNLQIIVVGDHCIDDTGSRVAALRDDRIMFHNLPERGPYPPPGQDRWRVAGSNPENKALTLCEGQFITHLDDDDRADTERIATLVSAAQTKEADFCWHPFWWENPDGSWRVLGNGTFAFGQIGTSSIFYHRYFARYGCDVFAYRLGEPGDWNRLRKIKMLRPRLCFIDKPLVYHYEGSQKEAFLPQPGESFLE